MKTLERLFDPFSLADIQTFKNIVLTLKQYGYTADDGVGYIISLVDKQKKINDLTKLCPDCGQSLKLFPIKEDNEYNYRSKWTCTKGWKCHSCKEEDRFDETDPKDICGWEEDPPSTKTYKERADEYTEEVNKIMIGE